MELSRNVALPPVRPLADFVGSEARFAVPDYKDPVRWNNRIVNNLLYYQTNYIAVATGIFILAGLTNPLAMLVGMMLVTVVFWAFITLTENQRQLQRFKKDHPTVCVAGLLAACYFIMRTFQLLLVFVFGITLPLLVVLVHASLRMRNLKNKLSNKVESIGIKRTPMGILLEALGQEQEAGS
uniref:PRA1 family protein n=1 Tax=Branchiostoma floridae TaxID=7739 RepID=C3ZWK5_BRAFL|eukprot:XP_002587063.1 hypothetical protein BRAFLDRAFT_243271 [Branchiostoma floridae]